MGGGPSQLTNSSDVALSNLLVCELRDEAGLAYPTVSTQKHFEQMVIITVCHLTHWRGEVGGRREDSNMRFNSLPSLRQLEPEVGRVRVESAVASWPRPRTVTCAADGDRRRTWRAANYLRDTAVLQTVFRIRLVSL